MYQSSWNKNKLEFDKKKFFDIVKNNPDMGWCQYELIKNPSIEISPCLIRENPDIWNNFIILSIPSLFTFD